MRTTLLILALAFAATIQADSHSGTKMLRFPDLHGDQLVFSYAGDLWLANIDGSAPARRLTSHPGLELYPKFSPDGRHIAFAGQYRGDEQVYVISIDGGEPTQLTYYPTAGPLPARWGTDHQVYGWSADGKNVIFRSLREMFGNGKLYQVSMEGGLPTALPMPRAGSGDMAPDGKRIVYSPLFRDFRTWKRYQGGWAQNLYIFDLDKNEATQITDHARTERDPIWLQQGIHFVADWDGKLNLYRYDPDSGAATKATEHDEWDIKWASGDGVSRIVYEVAGTVGLYDATAGSETLLSITVPDDHVRRTARRLKVDSHIEDFEAAPDGNRVVMTARGDVFSVPVEHGVTRNLTRRGDAHDREAAWSPDGQYIAFVSDRMGEEALFLVDQDGGEARVLASPQELRLYRPRWSPDSQHIAYYDHTGTLHVTDLKGKHRTVYHHDYHLTTDYTWSPDSKWIAFSRHMENSMDELVVWSADDGKIRPVTEGFFNTHSPSFSPDGNHLYFISERQFAPQIGSFEWNYVVDRENGLFALALNKDAGNPFAPRNDEVEIKKDEEDDDQGDNDKDEEKDDKVSVNIDFDGLAERVIRVPIEADNLFGVLAQKERLLYITGGPFYYGRQADVNIKLHAYDLKKRESKAIAEDIQGVSLTANEQYAVVRKNDGFHRVEIASPDKPKKIGTDNLIVYRAPAEEWPVIFDEVWRRFRDYFYVPNLHGYDWVALRDQYRPLIEDVSTREDLNTLIGEMIAELNVGHAYVAGGDLQAPDRSSAALLGARFEADRRSKRYRIAHIYEGQNEEEKYRSPLTEVGVNVDVGDYILAIDGRELTTADNPYDVLTDRGNQPVELTVNDKASTDGARTVLVNGIGSETNLVYLEWVNHNRRYVDEQTDGTVGYLHIPDMGANGIYEFIKWFYPQIRKQGLIVDVRGNGGGNVSQMIIRRLMQKPLAFNFQAHNDWTGTYPATAFNGSMVSLINEDSASDGDIFPYFFREAGLGPLIGKKTWGGTVGITGHGPLIDGGQVFVPEFGLGQPGKGWIIEGEGVSPDIEVANDPASDVDAQLDRGITEVTQRIQANPPEFLPKPPAPTKLD